MHIATSVTIDHLRRQRSPSNVARGPSRSIRLSFWKNSGAGG